MYFAQFICNDLNKLTEMVTEVIYTYSKA